MLTTLSLSHVHVAFAMATVLNKLEQGFLAQPWARVREGVDVKRLSVDEDTYVLAQSAARIDKERAMRRRRLARYVQRLHALQGQVLTRDQLLMKLGAAKHEAGRAANLIKTHLPQASASRAASFEFELDRAKLRQVRRREGRYLLRTNLAGHDPAQLWSFLHPAHRGRAGVQGTQARPGGASDLPLQ